MPEPDGPLTQGDFEEMQTQLAALDQADKLIDQAIRGGIDMAEQRLKARELRERITKLRQSFFPGR